MRLASLSLATSLLALNLVFVLPAAAQLDPNAGPGGSTNDGVMLEGTQDTSQPAPLERGPDMEFTLEESEANNPGPRLDNPLGTDDVREVIARIIQLMTGISGSIALAVFVYGGFNWVIAGGNEERIKKGKQAFKYGALGLVIIFGSYVAVRAIYEFLGQAAG